MSLVPYSDPQSPRALESARAAKRRHYEKNREVYRKRARARTEMMKQLVRARCSQPCLDCGIEYPYYVMEFDHLPGTLKVANISALISRGVALLTLIEEMDKCEVVCANCHRIRTWLRRQPVVGCQAWEH